MKLYHGSTVYIDTIDILHSKVGKDFGCGFYLSPDKIQAEKMAAKKAAQTQSDTPCVTIYEIDENSILSQLNCLTFEGYSKEWAEFVLANRKNRKRENIHEYDCTAAPFSAAAPVPHRMEHFIHPYGNCLGNSLSKKDGYA